MINAYDYILKHPDTFKIFSVKDLLFVHYKCPQVEKQVKLWAHYNLISFTVSGKKTFYHGEKSWTITENSSFFVRKNAFKQEVHAMVGWEILGFYFRDDFLRQVFNEYKAYFSIKNLPPVPPDMLMEIKVNETIRAFFYSIIPYFARKLPPPEGLLELKFKELLFNIFNEPSNYGILSYAYSINDENKTPLWQIIESNYMYNLTIAEFARLANRSATSFKKEFHEYYHTTPGKWLTNKRLEHARLLLKSSKKNISEIVYDCGFENISHFSRIFKEKYQLSPLLFIYTERFLSYLNLVTII